MKILSIEFENINSLKGKHRIDFSKPPLSETGIFAIVGPTGSGKSTLLDVITLALYRKIARFNKEITENTVIDSGTAVTRGTDRAFAQVEYSNNDKIYRSKFSILKRRINYSISMELADAVTNEVIEATLNKVPEENEKIIGLNYDQFLKSIILPQGNFAQFLKAKPEERISMLEKITGTQIYRTIGKRSFDIAKYYEQLVNQQKSILNTIDTLSQEQIDLLLTEKEDNDKKFIEIKTVLENLNAKIQIKTEIEKLNNEINPLKIQLENISQQISEFKPNKEKLIIHKQLLNFSKDFFDIENTQKQITENNDEISKTNKLLEDIILKKSNLEPEIEKFKNELKFSQEILDSSQIFVSQAKEFATSLKIKQNEAQSTNKTYNEKYVELTKLQNTINQSNTELNELSQKQSKLLNALEKDKILENLSSEIIKIETNFKIYSQIKEKTEKIISESSFHEFYKNKTWNEFRSITELTKKNIEEKINKIATDDILDFQPEITEKEEEKLENQIKLIEQLKQFSENYTENFPKLNEIVNQNIKLTIDIQQNTDLLNKTNHELEIIEKTVEELDIRLKKEQLEAKYEDDRLNLVENEPCPLCGSIDHPFANYTLKKNANSTQELLNSEKIRFKNLQKSSFDIDKNLQTLQTKFSANEQNISEINQLTNTIILKFSEIIEKLNIKLEIDKIQEIEQKLKFYENKLDNLHEKTKKYNILKQLQAQVKEIITIYTSIEETINQRELIRILILPFSSYYQKIETLDKIILQLNLISKNYQQQIKELQNINSEINVLQQKLEMLKSNNIDLANEVNKIKVQLIEQNEQVSEYQTKYKSIVEKNLENLDPDNFVLKYNKKIEDYKKNIIEFENQVIALNAKKSQLEVHLFETNDKLFAFSSNLDKKSVELLQKISSIGFDNIESAQSSILPTEIALQFEQKQNELNDLFNKISEKFATYSQQLKELKNEDDSKFSLEQVKKQYFETETQQTELSQQLGTINEKLNNNTIRTERKKIEQSKFDELSQQHLRWRKLYNLIGDAEGKKFAKIAQQVTLSELIAIANKHLKTFSNRYILDKSDDTNSDLFVYDIYLGMSKRSVHTLSGGETFLISLSLALALSDMASRNTKIESLFIDEGFGTLDNETLDLALKNLEKLHNNDNRTIGIISHVPQIKERIFTKIVINKTNSGFSAIVIES